MTRYVYVGGGTNTAEGHRQEGIHIFRMDPENGKLTQIYAVESGPNPTFLAFSAGGEILFAVNETNDGAASAFRVDRATGGLSLINRVKVGGDSPCYLSPDPAGRWILVANYSSGSLSVLPVESGGRLGERLQVVTHEGSSSDSRRRLISRDEKNILAVIQLPGAGDTVPEGVRPERQERSHAHCILFDPGRRYALAADLGQDRVWVYRQGTDGRLSPASEKLEWCERGWIGPELAEAAQDARPEGSGNPISGHSLKPGAGPRHLVFHPNGRFLYVSTELASTVTVFAWDGRTGELRPIQDLSALPADYLCSNDAAHLAFSPDGRYLYVSNRGHNSLAAFGVDGESGLLTPTGHFSTLGNWPRNFGVCPDGRFVLVANQESNSVVVFRVQPKTGALEPAGYSAQVFKPMFVMAVDF